MIDATDSAVEDVELLRDGSWRVVKKEIMSLSDDDNDVHIDSSKSNKKTTNLTTKSSDNNSSATKKSSNNSEHPPKLKQSTTLSTASLQSNYECEIITLSDSDDNVDDDENFSAPILQPIAADLNVDLNNCDLNSNNSNCNASTKNQQTLNTKHQKNNKNKTSKSTCDIRRYICVYKRKNQ